MAETNTNTFITCGNSSSCESNQATFSIGPGVINPEASSSSSTQAVDRIKLLYPNVNENETPLPRIWNRVDKHLSIRLSPNSLRVQYTGAGNQAASVRTAYPIPSTCGIYYFEVKIISNGKHGYIAIGLTSPHFRMNRLPGWNKKSYGLHGDDGYVYSSRALGYKYGPTFDTGDIIGCCFNMVNSILFFTMNGKDMGTAFQHLPKKLYPTVGLQTRGEEIEVNFGQQPFKFTKIESIMEEMRSDMMSSILNFSLSAPRANTKNVVDKLVSTYLVHYGYSVTAEAFSQATGHNLGEDIASIKTRKQILMLIMGGHVSEAIEMALRLYPGVLDNKKNVLFMLQCRQFIEMTIKVAALELSDNNNSSIADTTTETTTAIETTGTETTTTATETTTTTTTTETTTAATTETTTTTITTSPPSPLEHLLGLCKDLSFTGQQLENENKLSDEERKLMQDSISSLAYTDPWKSPLVWQLCPSKRESVCRALNSAILEKLNKDKLSPLELCVAQAGELLKVMSLIGLGESAYAHISEVFPKEVANKKSSS